MCRKRIACAANAVNKAIFASPKLRFHVRTWISLISIILAYIFMLKYAAYKQVVHVAFLVQSREHLFHANIPIDYLALSP
jgi:hypothetical protein